MKKRAAILLMLGLMPWAGLHAQQTAQTTFKVLARVEANCVVTATDLDFGAYTSPGGAQLLATTPLRVTCTPSTTYHVGLDQGQSPGATVNQRK